MKKLTTLAALLGLLLASCTGNSATSSIPQVAAESNASQAGDNSQLQSAAQSDLATNGLAQSLAPAVTTLSFPGVGAGNAYAAKATVQTNLGTSVIAGPIAPAGLGCGSIQGTSQNSVATVNLAGLATSSTASDVVTSTHTSSSAAMTSTSTVQNLNVLNGLITATVLKAQANSTATAGVATSNENGSQFTALKVLGLPVNANPAPNTNITLPGIGYVVLNEVIGPVNGTTSTKITVNMIHVHVTTANNLGIKVGTNIIIASATSSIVTEVAPFILSADAYSLYARGYAGNINLKTGPLANAGIGCFGGSSENRLLDTTTPVGTVGVMDNTASGTNTVATSSAHARSSTASVNLLNGLITGHAIVTTALTDRSGTTFTHSASMTFTDLTIAGAHINANVAPNTKILLANLGYVIVNQQSGAATSTSATQSINGLAIYITTSNALGLPVGAQIIVAHANATIRGF